MLCVFYQDVGDYRVVNKTLVNGVELNVKVRTDLDFERPKLMVANFNRKWTYFSFNDAYYYVNEFYYSEHNITTVTGRLDVLTTYKDEIKKCYGKVRATANPNIYYNGGDYEQLVKHNIKIVRSNVTLPSKYSNVLITV